MSKLSLPLSEPLTLGQTEIPRSTRYSGKGIALISLLIGLIFAAVLLSQAPVADSDDGLEKPATAMFGSPPTVQARMGPVALRGPAAMAPAMYRPQVSTNAITKEKKIEQLNNLRYSAAKSDLVVLMENKGLISPEQYDMRVAVHKANGSMLIIKNSLAERAFKGTKNEPLVEHLGGPTFLILNDKGGDPPELAKAILEGMSEHAAAVEEDNKHAKTSPKNKPFMAIKGAVVEGQYIDEAGLKRLSKSPTKKELITMIAVMLNKPAAKIATLIKEAGGGKLARAIKAIEEKQKEEGGGD